MQLTDLLAKPLIHLTEAKTLGNVYGFWTDKHFRRIRYVQILDEETYAHPLAYAWGRVRVGQDALAVVSDPQDPIGVFVPFKGAIYDTDGAAKGYLQDAVCTGTGMVDHLVTTDGQVYYPKDVVSVGDILVVRGTRRVSRPRKTSPPALPLEEAFNLPASAPAPVEPTPVEVPAPAPQLEPAPSGIILPRAPLPQEINALPEGINVRLVGDYSFLLGRTLTGDLVRHGRVLLPKGTIIDERAVSLARTEGQLVALTSLSV